MYTTLVVMDSGTELPGVDLKTIPFDQYLADYPKLGEPKTRIINLCDTELYLSRGYYCSLLAESRKHQALPSVNTINDLRKLEDPEETRQLWAALAPLVPAGEATPQCLFIYFGQVEASAWQALAKALFERFPAPILKVVFPQEKQALSLSNESPGELPKEEQKIFQQKLRTFTEKVWRSPKRRKYRWEMAILYDPDEQMPPSDSEAIQRFLRAAAKVGIEAETVRSIELSNIAQYDALFIRETTSINHPTYRLARKAEKEGLVVMDDPSIEHRVEDHYLGDELYMMIMQEFADRLEQRGRN